MPDKYQYFYFAPDCYFVNDTERPAIYDVNSKKIYVIDEDLSDQSMREMSNGCVTLSSPSLERLCQKLRKLGIGTINDDGAYIDSMRLKQDVMMKELLSKKPEFKKMDWSITNKCDLGCYYCGDNNRNYLIWQSCTLCAMQDNDSNEQWLPNDIDGFLDDMQKLGIDTVHIRGGNPLLEMDVLHDVLNACEQKSLNIMITTPGTGAEVEDILNLYKLNSRLVLNIVMFSLDEETVGNSTRTTNVLEHQLGLINLLINSNLKFMFTFALDYKNKTVEQDLETINTTEDVFINIAEIYKRDKLPPDFKLNQIRQNGKRLVGWSDHRSFSFRHEYNSCTFGNVAVDYRGRISTCSGLNQKFSSMSEHNVCKSLNIQRLYDSWEYHKGKVTPCKECSMKYVCLDCTTFEVEGEHNSTISSSYCLFNKTDNKQVDYDNINIVGSEIEIL